MGNYNWDINKLRYLSGLAEQPNRKSKAINEEGETVDNQGDKLTLLERIEQEYDGEKLNEQLKGSDPKKIIEALNRARANAGYYPAGSIQALRSQVFRRTMDEPTSHKAVAAFYNAIGFNNTEEPTKSEFEKFLQNHPLDKQAPLPLEARREAYGDINTIMASTNKKLGY